MFKGDSGGGYKHKNHIHIVGSSIHPTGSDDAGNLQTYLGENYKNVTLKDHKIII